MINHLKQLYRIVQSLCLPGVGEALIRTLRNYSFVSKIQADHPGLVLDKDVIIQGYSPTRLNIKGHVQIEHGSILAFGNHFNGYGTLSIYHDTWIGEYNNFRLGADCRISIGERCLISQHCSFIGVNHDVSSRDPVTKLPPDSTKKDIIIGHDVWIGAGSVLLPGTEIGDGAVIGANSLISASVPSCEIWAGNPGRKIRTR